MAVHATYRLTTQHRACSSNLESNKAPFNISPATCRFHENVENFRRLEFKIKYFRSQFLRSMRTKRWNVFKNSLQHVNLDGQVSDLQTPIKKVGSLWLLFSVKYSKSLLKSVGSFKNNDYSIGNSIARNWTKVEKTSINIPAIKSGEKMVAWSSKLGEVPTCSITEKKLIFRYSFKVNIIGSLNYR